LSNSAGLAWGDRAAEEEENEHEQPNPSLFIFPPMPPMPILPMIDYFLSFVGQVPAIQMHRINEVEAESVMPPGICQLRGFLASTLSALFNPLNSVNPI